MMAMSKGESDGEFLKADWRLIAPLRLLGTVVSAEAKNDEERGGCGGKEGAFRDICGKPLSSASLYVLGVGVRGDADSHPSASSSISRRQQSSYRVGNAGDRGHTSSGVSGDSAHSTDGRRDEAGEAGGVATARELTSAAKTGAGARRRRRRTTSFFRSPMDQGVEEQLRHKDTHQGIREHRSAPSSRCRGCVHHHWMKSRAGAQPNAHQSQRKLQPLWYHAAYRLRGSRSNALVISRSK
ncbi:hypothetical protein TcYC6_0077010 [Trypanosoma cruzi]|nr:hypothetical protein TcYC6_0077010 [Trypanosoma cruzi]